MAQRVEMSQSKLGGEMMVEHNVCDTRNGPMTGDSNNGDGKGVLQSRVDGNERFCTSAKKHLAVLFNQILLMSVVRGEIRISCVHQVIANTAHDLSVITITQFRHQDSYGLRTARAKRARQKAWLVIQFFCGGLDAFTRSLRNGAAGNLVENNRNGCGI